MPSRRKRARAAAVADGASQAPTDADEQSTRPNKKAKPDPDGDLTLNVAPGDNDEPCSFRVCSATLRRHSPVWKAMLFSPAWIESKPANEGEDWVVELPEDPARPMEIILDIIHGRFECVPKELSLKDLRDILVLTNKYDMTGIVRPWCEDWIKAARYLHPVTDEILSSLFVAWELGDEHLFAIGLADIAMHTKVGEEGRLIYTATMLSVFATAEDYLFKLNEAFDTCGRVAILEDEDRLGPHDALGGLDSRSRTGFANKHKANADGS